MPRINWQDVVYFFTYHPEQPLLFNSIPFFVLFLAFYGGYLLLLRLGNWRIAYTLAFSLFFYYKCSGWFFLLLIFSTLIDFGLGHWIYRTTHRSRRLAVLWLSILANLGLLGYFKYTNFFIETTNALTQGHWSTMDIFLPVGISFFTFQTLSYSIDIYRGNLVPLSAQIRDWKSAGVQVMNFAFYVSFFPQLVAGPIVRAAEFLPQLALKPQLTQAILSRSLLLIMGGLFKKAVISDYISLNFVDRVFENPSLYSGVENLLAGYGYALQIFCDFSGYSDMAIGLALLLGFQLPENFRSPYRAATVQEFWRRWHMSLSTWLRDYLYISLGGNRHGRKRTYLNLMITMLLGGLWHGASWVFVIWGGLHGVALVIDRWLTEQGKWLQNAAVRGAVILWSIGLVLVLVIAGQWLSDVLDSDQAWVLFRALAGAMLVILLLIPPALALDALFRRPMFSKVLGILFTFHFVVFGWVFFRAGAIGAINPPLDTVGQFLVQVGSFWQWEVLTAFRQAYPAVLAFMIAGYLLHYFPNRWSAWLEQQFSRWSIWGQSLALALVIWIVIQTASTGVTPFIYFQF